ncbi:MAG: hypothetical protein J6D27_02520 [Ruminiclostridium sp.]|nr:hypothetical protein [Ruminiclostridium sp.]
MANFTLSELNSLSEIIDCEKNIYYKYEEYSKIVTDPQLKDKLQRCAAAHKNQYTLLEEFIKG